MFFLLLSFCFSFPKPVFEFQNSVMAPGTVVEKIFKRDNAHIKSNFSFVQCNGFCQLELIAFKESERQLIFPKSNFFRPICCKDPQIQNCSSVGLLKLNDNNNLSIYRRLFKIEGAPISNELNITNNNNNNKLGNNDEYFVTDNKKESDFDGENYWTFVLANCGNTEFRLSGSADFVNNKNTIFDKTIYILGCISILFFISFVIFTIIYLYLTCDLKKIALNHQIFTASLILLCLYFLANSINFFVQSLTGRNLTLLLILCSILRSLATVTVLYITLISLQYPLEVKTTPFIIVFFFFIFSSFVELSGLFSIVSKTVSGKWMFGYGCYNLSFADFLVNTFSTFSLLIYAIRTSPQEASEEERRKCYLILLHLLIISYFVLISLATFNSLNKDIVSFRTKNVFFGYLIHSSFLFLANVFCGWFIHNFNPLGWQKLPSNANGSKKKKKSNKNNNKNGDDDDDSDLLGLANALGTSDSEPGFIPDVNLKPVSKKMKMKRKSDDGFDFDDDTFLDSEKPVEIESKLD